MAVFYLLLLSVLRAISLKSCKDSVSWGIISGVGSEFQLLYKSAIRFSASSLSAKLNKDT